MDNKPQVPQNPEEFQEFIRQAIIKRAKKYGPFHMLLMCKNCGYLNFMRELEELSSRCPVCLWTELPPNKMWLKIRLEPIGDNDV